MTQASMASAAPTSTDLALIHGWGLGQAAWQPLVAALDPAIRVHLIDLPGYGTAPASPESFAHHAAALLETLPAGTVLCGWSLGGMLALQAACLAPQRLGGLILIGATPSFTQRADWPPAQPPALLESFTAAIAEDAAGTLQRFIALLNQGDRKARHAIRALAQALASAPLADSGSLLQGLDWLRDVDLRPQLAALTMPALLIHGEHDPLMPLAAAQWLQAELNGAHLESRVGKPETSLNTSFPRGREPRESNDLDSRLHGNDDLDSRLRGNDGLFGTTLEIIPGAAHAPFIHTPERIAALIGDYCHASAFDKATRPRVV